LRSDTIKKAVDIYFHVDPKDVQEAYLAAIPQLGIWSPLFSEGFQEGGLLFWCDSSVR
jgi:hypothetical protein